MQFNTQYLAQRSTRTRFVPISVLSLGLLIALFLAACNPARPGVPANTRRNRVSRTCRLARAEDGRRCGQTAPISSPTGIA